MATEGTLTATLVAQPRAARPAVSGAVTGFPIAIERQRQEAQATPDPNPGDAEIEELIPEGELSDADIATLILDLAGIVDPTPVSDGASALLSLFRGDWESALLSAAAIVPGDDLTKLAKFARLFKGMQHLAKYTTDLNFLNRFQKSLKHVPFNGHKQATATMNRLAGDAAKRHKNTSFLQKATKLGLPTSGPVPFVPPKSWNVSDPRTRSRQNDYIDAYDNAWVWDRTKGEWDVQIPGPDRKFGIFSSDGKHANISPEGYVTH